MENTVQVLIIDDEPLIRRSLGRAFHIKGHEVHEAVDGREGVEKWKALSPDVVFLDVLMPGLSGPEVLQAMGPNKKGKVILMSAYSGDHNMDTATRMGAQIFIPKPFDDIFGLVQIAEQL
jgi:DNA-binding NtrC family response regulator